MHKDTANPTTCRHLKTVVGTVRCFHASSSSGVLQSEAEYGTCQADHLRSKLESGSLKSKEARVLLRDVHYNEKRVIGMINYGRGYIMGDGVPERLL